MKMCFGRFTDDYINLVERYSSFFGVVEKLGEGGLIKSFTTIDEKSDFRGGLWGFHFRYVDRKEFGLIYILLTVFLFGFRCRGFGEEFGNGIILGGISISQSISIFNEHCQFNSEPVIRVFFQSWWCGCEGLFGFQGLFPGCGDGCRSLLRGR